MIVDNLDIDRARRARWPLEADPPLVVDADAVLPRAVAFKRLQPVAGKCSDVGQALRGLQAIEPRFRLPGEAGQLPHTFPGGEAVGSPVPVADASVRKAI